MALTVEQIKGRIKMINWNSRMFSIDILLNDIVDIFPEKTNRTISGR